jgi:Na+-transporting NADH:ubiquinone oxidoreductase subunit C
VAVLLCLVCSLLVSASAVGLRQIQEANKLREKQKNILIAAGLFDPDKHGNADVKELFAEVTPRILDLETGEYLSESEAQEILDIKNISDYDQALAANQPEISYTVAASDDVAGIKRREKYSYVYEVKEGDEVKQWVLPIRGYGLWSTLWGFVAVDAQSLKQGPEHLTITGLKYYEQKETPGLGGEVDNPNWLAQWPGKHIYDANWNVKIDVAKTGADKEYHVDAISGATITSNGVTNMMDYWFGENGFRPFLKKQSGQ